MTDDIYEDNASGGLMDVDDIDADIQTISIMLWHIHIQIFVYLDVFITLYYNLWNFIYTNLHKFSVISYDQSVSTKFNGFAQCCHGNPQCSHDHTGSNCNKIWLSYLGSASIQLIQAVQKRNGK